MAEPLDRKRLEELIRLRKDEHFIPGPQDEADILAALKEYEKLRKETP